MNPDDPQRRWEKKMASGLIALIILVAISLAVLMYLLISFIESLQNSNV